MRKKQILLLAALVITGLSIMFLADEWNRAAIGSSGYIDKGTKFGISIESEFEDARQLMSDRGLYPTGLSGNRNLSKTGQQNCHGIEYADEILLQAYLDDSWRKGIICIASKDGIIVGLSWYYGMFQV